MEAQKRRKIKLSWKVFPCVMVLFVFLVSPCIAGEDPAKYPSKPIRFIVQWSPGGTTDLSSRRICDLASKILGQPIVVENKVGGSGITGASAVAKSPPDGYTIGSRALSTSRSPANLGTHAAWTWTQKTIPTSKSGIAIMVQTSGGSSDGCCCEAMAVCALPGPTLDRVRSQCKLAQAQAPSCGVWILATCTLRCASGQKRRTSAWRRRAVQGALS